VRVFTVGPGGVLPFSSDVYVCAARYGDVVLWHYAFERHWLMSTTWPSPVTHRAFAP
jgi:hypothetical protein